MASRFFSRIATGALMAWHSTVGWPARRHPVRLRRILVADHLLLGDTLMLTPLLAKLREQYPEAEIEMTCPVALAPLYQYRPYGVQALPYDPRDLRTLQRLLPHRGFDLALVPGDNRYSWLARALSSQWIVAFAGDAPNYKNWPVNEQRAYPNAPAAWGDIAAMLVDGPAPQPYCPSQWPAPQYTPFVLPERPYVVLHAGAGSRLRYWKSDRWRAVAQHMVTKGLEVVLSAGRRERDLIDVIDPENRYLHCAGNLDLAQLWRLLSGARLLICPDTGVAHLARITGTPHVVLFGPGSPVLFGGGEFWRNIPSRSVFIPNYPCRNENRVFRRDIPWAGHCARSPYECHTPQCMHALDVHTVIASASELLAEVPQTHPKSVR